MYVNYESEILNSDFQTVQKMADLAFEFKDDAAVLSDLSLKEYFDFVQSRYLLETEEQLLRPYYFYMIGGDCDDQAVAMAAYFLHRNLDPSRMFFVDAAKNSYYEHIFFVIDGFCFDALPKLQMGECAGNRFRSFRLSDLI